jgi:hypothetical protein
VSGERKRALLAADRLFATTFRQIAFASIAAAALRAIVAPAAAAIDCDGEAQTLSREETQLPRLEIASPRDRPPYCITLETLMAFATRVKLHVAQCPQSNYAAAAAQWAKAQTDYSRLFGQYRCKPTIKQVEKPVRARHAR